jgi:predicted flap endonuclease-1-like 5' DNA nuclease
MMYQQNGPKEKPPWGRKRKLTTVEGIGENYARQLRVAGIATTEALLGAGSSPQGRAEVAARTGISGKLILEWVNHVDLFRIKGVGEEYSDLLEEAGVDTVPELAQRNPANLYEKLKVTNEEKELVRKLPSEGQVADWVKQATALPRIIEY